MTSKVVDISVKLYGVMDNLRDNVEIFDQDFKYNLSMQEMAYQLNRIDESMTEVAKTKRENTFDDFTLASSILEEITKRHAKVGLKQKIDVNELR